MEEKKFVVTVMSDGSVDVGPGYTVGDILKALERAKNAVLGVVLNQGEKP